jgi:hypothetical protein
MLYFKWVHYIIQKYSLHILQFWHKRSIRKFLSRSAPRSLEYLFYKVISLRNCYRTFITRRRLCRNEGWIHTMLCRKDDLNTITREVILLWWLLVVSVSSISWVPAHFSPNLHHKFELRNTTNSITLQRRYLWLAIPRSETTAELVGRIPLVRVL